MTLPPAMGVFEPAPWTWGPLPGQSIPNPYQQYGAPMANLYTQTWNPYQNIGAANYGASLWTDYAPPAAWAGESGNGFGMTIAIPGLIEPIVKETLEQQAAAAPPALIDDSTRKTLNMVVAGAAILGSWWLWEKLFWGPRRRRGIKAWQLWKA